MEDAWEGHRKGMGGVWRCMGGAYEGDGRTMGWDLLFYLLYWSFALTLFDRTNCPMREIKLVSLHFTGRLSPLFSPISLLLRIYLETFFFYLRIVNEINFADFSVSYCTGPLWLKNRNLLKEIFEISWGHLSYHTHNLISCFEAFWIQTSNMRIDEQLKLGERSLENSGEPMIPFLNHTRAHSSSFALQLATHLFYSSTSRV